MLKLYYSAGTCSLSPHIVLRETGTPFKLVKADIRAKTVEDGSDFFAVNPNGYVPALQLEDGTVLTEGPAIVQYIADKAKAEALAPANGSLDRYKLQQWLNFVSTEMHKGFSPLFNPALAEDAKQVFRDRLHARLKTLEAHLTTHDYLTGRSFSIADAYLFTVLNWAQPMKIDLAGYPHIESYRARILARPAVQEAMKAEGLIK